MFLTEQPKQMPEFLRASPGSAPNWGAQCFSEMAYWASWIWGVWHIKPHMLKREWQMWDLERWEVTHKVNPQVPGEDEPCRRGKTVIWMMKGERRQERLSNLVRWRACTYRFQLELGLALKGCARTLLTDSGLLPTTWREMKDVGTEMWPTVLDSCDTSPLPSHRCRLFPPWPFSHTGATPQCLV